MPMARSRRFIALPAVRHARARRPIATLMLCEPDTPSGLPTGLPDILFDFSLRLAQIVHRAVRHLAPIREAHFQGGIPERLVDGIQVRLQLLNGQGHINSFQPGCGAVSMGLRRARRAPGVRSDSLSASLSNFAGAAAWLARAAARSRAKMVSPRSAVRYCTTSFHFFL